MKKIIAIDPGASGAAVFDTKTGISFEKLTGDRELVANELRGFVIGCGKLGVGNGDIVAVVEDVGKHVAGNAAQGSIALARNHQNIKTCLYMLGIETVDVSPQRWTKEMGVQVKDERTKEEKQRIRNLPKAEKDKEVSRHRRNQKAKKNEKIRALLKENKIDDSKIPDYALDAYGIYLFGKKVHTTPLDK